MKTRLLLCLAALLAGCSTPKPEPKPTASLLSAGWDAKAAADKVMAGLIKVTGPDVKGAHDSHLAIVGDRAFVISEVNERQAGEAASWPFIYTSLSIVDLRNERLLDVMTVARSEQAFANETLPVGACFVPRVKQVSPQYSSICINGTHLGDGPWPRCRHGLAPITCRRTKRRFL